jgi:hypothetical protein
VPKSGIRRLGFADFTEVTNMNKSDDIDELRQASDQAEEEYQRTLRARIAAVADSQQALKAATKARSRYMRALGQQGEAGNDA